MRYMRLSGIIVSTLGATATIVLDMESAGKVGVGTIEAPCSPMHHAGGDVLVHVYYTTKVIGKETHIIRERVSCALPEKEAVDPALITDYDQTYNDIHVGNIFGRRFKRLLS